ncbi:MAG: hypothetical protein M1383_04180 [Patescibacteria group bacterium]|nr:hypothetical protein [Patescibacteria group bacterium]
MESNFNETGPVETDMNFQAPDRTKGTPRRVFLKGLAVLGFGLKAAAETKDKQVATANKGPVRGDKPFDKGLEQIQKATASGPFSQGLESVKAAGKGDPVVKGTEPAGGAVRKGAEDGMKAETPIKDGIEKMPRPKSPWPWP